MTEQSGLDPEVDKLCANCHQSAIVPSIGSVEDATFSYHGNFAQVGFSPHYFEIKFGRHPENFSSEEIERAMREKGLKLPCDAQIVVPATMIDGLIWALNAAKALYEGRYGPIREQRDTTNRTGEGLS